MSNISCIKENSYKGQTIMVNTYFFLLTEGNTPSMGLQKVIYLYNKLSKCLTDHCTIPHTGTRRLTLRKLTKKLISNRWDAAPKINEFYSPVH